MSRGWSVAFCVLAAVGLTVSIVAEVPLWIVAMNGFGFGYWTGVLVEAS